MVQPTLEIGLGGFKMNSEKEYKEYLINSKIKSLNGKISLIGTEEDSGESLQDLQAQIQALTNLLEAV
jgi:stalled ribosome rescue protein Dom34